VQAPVIGMVFVKRVDRCNSDDVDFVEFLFGAKKRRQRQDLPPNSNFILYFIGGNELFNTSFTPDVAYDECLDSFMCGSYGVTLYDYFDAYRTLIPYSVNRQNNNNKKQQIEFFFFLILFFRIQLRTLLHQEE
jgi:hypothetical protein